MSKLLRISFLTFSVGLIAALPTSAQPGPGGKREPEASVKDLEAELTKLREQTKELEKKLEAAKEKEKEHRPFGKGGFGPFGKGRGPMGKGFGFLRGRWGREGFGPMAQRRWGRGDEPKMHDKDGKGEQLKEPRRAESAKEGSTEKKLDQIQKDLEEIRRELRRRP